MTDEDIGQLLIDGALTTEQDVMKLYAKMQEDAKKMSKG